MSLNGIDNRSFDVSLETISETVDQNHNTDEEGVVNNNVNKVRERAQWGNGIEFLLSCIAMSVGLGNIWRFPFTAYENGGGAFLIPYLIVLVVIGRPVYYLEMCLGQFASRGNVKMFDSLTPAFKGIGYGQAVACISVATYYCSLMAITIFYFINSFTGALPWSRCDPAWTNVTCIPSKDDAGNNGTAIVANSISSSELYFKREVLKELTDITDGIGWPEWRLTLCLLAAWIPTYIVSMHGVQSSGKASYFLAVFPYVVMLTLLIRAVTLEGSGAGILYFINPNWTKLMEAKVWFSAVTQCFYSLNVGFGTIIMYASYNDFNHNIYRDTIIVAFMDTFTSILAGVTIFGILGNLAYKQGLNVSDVVTAGGTALAFISYPEAIAKFDSVPWLFAMMFFVMLYVLGVGSLIALQGSPFTIIMDHWPNLKKAHVSLGCVVCGFLLGLVYMTPGGQFIVTLVDNFGGGFVIFTLTWIEVIVVFWLYGVENFCDDIEFMLQHKVGVYWRLTWGLVTPCTLTGIFFYFIFTMERLTHEGHDYPDYILVAGWSILGIALLQIPIWWCYYVAYKGRSGHHKQAFKQSLSHDKWGPKNPLKYQEWINKKKELRDKRDKADLSAAKRFFYAIIGRSYY